MASKKTYFRSIEELENQELKQNLAQKEFSEEIPVEEFLNDSNTKESNNTSRRDFLKFLGFSTAAVTLASCEAPIVKSIPYIVKPEDVTPGVPNHYATSYSNGFDYANVLIKTREGRPIRVIPNKTAEYFGETNSRAQASVLSLYDSDKIQGPKIDGKDASWSEVDKLVKAKLSGLGEKKAVIVTPSMPSPTTKKLIKDFKIKYPTAEHVVFDSYDNSPALDAAEEIYGQRLLPLYDLKQTKFLLSFNANFLENYNGGGMEGDFAKARKPSKDMLRFVQVESNMSMTGSNADTRIPLKPTEVYKLLAEVYKGLTKGTSDKKAIELVKELKVNGSNSLVLADGNKEAYVLAYAINEILSSKAVSKEKAIVLKESNQAKFNQFLSDAKAGNVGALFLYEANPIYSFHDSVKVKNAMEKIGFTVSLSQKEDETASLAKILAPVPHWLESWNDFSPITGVYSLQQPTIQKIFDSRQFQDSLLEWMKEELVKDASATKNEQKPDSLAVNAAPVKSVLPKSSYTQKQSEYYDYLKSNWEATILPALGMSFNQALYNGSVSTQERISLVANATTAEKAVEVLSGSRSEDWQIQLYTKVSVGDGTDANNPWLQELPDPVTRASWDNYLTLNPLDAEKLNINIGDNANVTNGRMQFNGNYVNIEANGVKVDKVPVFIQPGQALGTVGFALGYGRKNAGKVGDGVGVNAYSLFKNGELSVANVKITRTETSSTHEFACIQMQNTLMGRYEIAREANLSDVLNKPAEEWNEAAIMPTWRGDTPVGEVDLWESFDRTDGPHFNLSIDLNSCTGCAACIVACQAENNVPVVGKDEIRRSRDMFWLRIDRYYSDVIHDETGENYTQKKALQDETRNEPQQYAELIKPGAENPDVIFQPMMCQHCNHAPCETVCPVAATSHGKQGQNMMAYNRCVGTRYCANNCPYKVRRFNWFNYVNNDKFDFNMNNDLGRMVLNPDVAVRTRGVMEKCSLCIQSTQAVILKAKTEGRRVRDEEFNNACACVAACSSGAMRFGDINDPKSEVSKLKKGDRKYEVLEEVGTKPNVFYHVKVRNA